MNLEPILKGSFSPVKDYFRESQYLSHKLTLGERITRARLALGAQRGEFISQADFAAMVGVTGATMGNYESERTAPSYAMLGAMAKVLGVSAGWLAFGEPHEPRVEIPAEPKHPPPVELQKPTVRRRKNG